MQKYKINKAEIFTFFDYEFNNKKKFVSDILKDVPEIKTIGYCGYAKKDGLKYELEYHLFDSKLIKSNKKTKFKIKDIWFVMEKCSSLIKIKFIFFYFQRIVNLF